MYFQQHKDSNGLKMREEWENTGGEKGGKREWEMRRWGRHEASKSRDPSGLETGEIIEKGGNIKQKAAVTPQLYLLGEGGKNCNSESECSSCPGPGKAKLYIAPEELLKNQLHFETLFVPQVKLHGTLVGVWLKNRLRDHAVQGQIPGCMVLGFTVLL